VIDLKYLNKSDLLDIESGMYNRALDPDVALYNYEFDEEKNPAFLETSLYLYQNEDGGFGHALDFDNVNPNSTVFQTYQALKMFKEAGVYSINNDEVSKEILGLTFKYLSKRSRYSLKEKINDKFACAERFKGEDDNEMLFGILGYTILLLDKSDKNYKKAIELASANLSKLYDEKNYDYLTLEQFKIFLQAILMKEEFKDEFNNLQIKFNELEKKFLDTSDLKKDFFEVLSILEDFELSEEELKIQNEALDYLIDARKHHGMWENEHTWGNEDKYPEAMSAQLKWVGRATRYAMHFINKYNRIK